MKKISILFAILAFSSVNLFAQVGERFTEREGGYSLCPPGGWIPQEIPGFSMPFFCESPQTASGANMNILYETNNSPLADYVDSNIAGFKTVFADAVSTNKTSFRTSGRINGYKVQTTYSMGNFTITAVQYFFENGNRKYCITYGSTSTTVNSYLNKFDESARTFELLK